MKLLFSFLRLIRLKNLFFIAITQVLFQYCVVNPIYLSDVVVFTNKLLSLLILSSVFIAAGGYIINDYFDIDIDQINKPTKNVIDLVISRRWAMLLHSLFSLIGVLVSFYIGWKLGIWWLGIANFLTTVLLFFYSTTFKKKALSGNIIISLLTAWSVALIGIATLYYNFTFQKNESIEANSKLFRITLLYAAFAFIISLIREALKDMEDVKGDSKYGAKTMPVIWGMKATKVYIAVWIWVLIVAVFILEIYSLQFSWFWITIYSFSVIIIPLLNILKSLFKASEQSHFHRLSSLAKWVMLTGILSLLFFAYYL